MGIFDAILGRRRQVRPRLDSLFLIPSAAITLQTAVGLEPIGSGSVCFRAPVGAAAQQTLDEIVALLRSAEEAPSVEVSQDDYGFTWLVTAGDPADTADLCTDLHAVNTTLEAQGFDQGLLCTLVPFRDSQGRSVGLVYLYKQGTFYPFAPQPGGGKRGGQRDTLLEMSVRDALAAELPMEPELNRWLAVWGAPGLA